MKLFVLLVSLIFIISFIGVSEVSAETYTYTKDGKTYVTTKTLLVEKVVVETKIYDSSGNLLETKVVENTPTATPVKKVTYPTGTITPTKPLLPTPTPIEKVITEIQETPVKTVLQTKFPMYVNKDSGKLVVKTDSRDIELNKNPEEIVKKAKQQGLDMITDMTLEESQDSVKYVVSGTKLEKFLAIFQIPLETKLVFDPETGRLDKKIQSNWTKIVDFLSI